jgi:hypothetical protein
MIVYHGSPEKIGMAMGEERVGVRDAASKIPTKIGMETERKERERERRRAMH